MSENATAWERPSLYHVTTGGNGTTFGDVEIRPVDVVSLVRTTAGRAFQQEDHVQQAVGLPHAHYQCVPPAAHSAPGMSSRKGSWRS